ncbi:hypothetical protein [Verrucosispora sp. NA02020]|uniref:hypothetical protein n=1 Tax=Verrucosispora sp. NA02020 TaxID=2742132 RepID=UPI003D731100
MSRLDEPPRGDVERMAQVVVTRHRDGRCGVCRPDGCRELTWAQPVVARVERVWMDAAIEAGR